MVPRFAPSRLGGARSAAAWLATLHRIRTVTHIRETATRQATHSNPTLRCAVERPLSVSAGGLAATTDNGTQNVIKGQHAEHGSAVTHKGDVPALAAHRDKGLGK